MAIDRRIAAPGLIVLIALLTSCARQPAQAPGATDTAAWEARRTRVVAAEDWQFRGRIGVQLEKDAWSATIYWRETRDTWTVRLMAPLGRGTFEMSGDAAGVELRTADNRLLRAADPETLMRDNLGWQLPVSGMHWWVRGLPHTRSEVVNLQIGADGAAGHLVQDGWRVNYADYRAAGDVLMPGTVSLENGSVRVRIVVSEWRVAP
jgi:outer membrane lipoprotein LolB